jgi:hypothetical protein
VKKVNELLIYSVMLDSLTVSYIKFVIMLTIKESAKSGTKVFVCVARL